MSWLLAAAGWGLAACLRGVLGVSRRRVENARSELACARYDLAFATEKLAEFIDRARVAEAGATEWVPGNCPPKRERDGQWWLVTLDGGGQSQCTAWLWHQGQGVWLEQDERICKVRVIAYAEPPAPFRGRELQDSADRRRRAN